MTNTEQEWGWFSGIGLRAASAVATLVFVLVLGVVTSQSAQSQTYTVLYNFQGGTDGDFPYAGLVSDAAGNLYGTTTEGGPPNYGTVFKVSGTTETVLYSFKGGADGATPEAPLIIDAAGNLYGTTVAGGSPGFGTVFEVTSNGTETVLHSFAGGTTDGCNPYGGLLRDKAGNLYGTTNKCGASDVGTVFKVRPNGKETVLHSFTGDASDGSYPYLTSLLIDAKGNLYGVAQNGGTGDLGVVYKLSKGGTLTVLHSFAGGTTDGCFPLGSPAMDQKGNLYGTTYDCGSSSYMGTVWKVSRKGTESVLHSFRGGAADGQSPYAGVVLDAQGNLYGDTIEGGTVDLGTVYELSKTGTLTVLHSFDGYTGSYPYGGVIRDAAGNVYSTGFAGGSSGYAGVVWEVTP